MASTLDPNPNPNSTAPPATTATGAAATPPRSRRPWYRHPAGIVTATIVAGSFVLWGYAFSGAARRDPPDTLHDLAYRQAAQTACAPYYDQVMALPPGPAARNPQERAATLTEANDLLGTMVTQLRQLQPDNDRDRDIVVKWLADWDQYMADRQAYAAVLATGVDAEFTLADRGGPHYTKSMENIAAVNDMASCSPPGDV